jgi:hypothetical protein
MLKASILVLAAMFLAQTRAASEEQTPAISTVTGAVLVRACRPERSEALADLCSGYILGVADVLQLQRRICRPESDIATLQTVEIVRMYIRDHPESWSEHGVALVALALLAAFPCISN